MKDYKFNEMDIREINSKEELIEALEQMSKLGEKIASAFNLSEELDEINNTLNSLGLSEEELSKINKLREPFEKLSSISPTKYIMPNNKAINMLAKGEILPGDIVDLLISKNQKKEIITNIQLNYDDDNIEISDKNGSFTPHDRAVCNALCSIWEAGNSNFTPDQVYRCMHNLTEGESVRPERRRAITEDIDRMRRMFAKINCGDEARAWRSDITNFIMEDFIISAKKVTLESGGKEVIGYRFNSKPILYEYAQISGQVLTIPSMLLKTKDLRRASPELTVIKEYLLRRIEVMKRKGNSNQSNNILLSSIYEEIEHPAPTKEKAKKIRDSISMFLDNLEREKYIMKFSFYKEGRTIKGVTIFL